MSIVPPLLPYAAPAPPPTPRRTGRLVAIVLGITLPVLAVLVAAGMYVVTRLVPDDGRDADETPTMDILAVPPVGACYAALDSSYIAGPFYDDRAERATRVSCDEPHIVETIDAGQIDEGEYPFEEEESARALFVACENAAELVLGSHWRATYTVLILGVPSFEAWQEGARWYRCDLGATTVPIGYEPVATSGNLRDSARLVTCLDWDEEGGTVERLVGLECNVPHRGELVGAFRMPESLHRSGIPEREVSLSSECLPLVEDYVGQDHLSLQLSWNLFYPRSSVVLDQSVVCFVVAAEAGRLLEGSLADLGSGSIPFA